MATYITINHVRLTGFAGMARNRLSLSLFAVVAGLIGGKITKAAANKNLEEQGGT
jgi:hypothetical protein